VSGIGCWTMRGFGGLGGFGGAGEVAGVDGGGELVAGTLSGGAVGVEETVGAWL